MADSNLNSCGMMSKKKRAFSPEFKPKVVPELLSGEKTDLTP